MNRLRVIVVAEHASRQFGGEAILPYHMFRLLRSRGVDAWLVVHERTREELLTLFPSDQDRLLLVEDSLLQRVFFLAGRLLPRRVSESTFGLANQMLTQLAQRRIVRKLSQQNSVVHQPIPVSPRFPSLMWNLGSPVVIGPLNGGMDYPPAFRSKESWWIRATVAVGRSFSQIANSGLPGKKKAAVILVANQRTRIALPSGLVGKVIELAENAVDLGQWRTSTEETQTTVPGRFLFIGRLVDWKALDIAVEAIGKVNGATLDVIGDGPMRASWQKLVTDRGLNSRIRFLGWASQADCARRVSTSCALVLPSLYECGGAVVLEAMAMGRPVIATDWGGPHDYLDKTCGILVPPTGRTELIEGFSSAMQRFMDAPAEAHALGKAGRKRVVECFDWEKKIDALLEIYQSALTGAAPRA